MTGRSDRPALRIARAFKRTGGVYDYLSILLDDWDGLDDAQKKYRVGRAREELGNVQSLGQNWEELLRENGIELPPDV